MEGDRGEGPAVCATARQARPVPRRGSREWGTDGLQSRHWRDRPSLSPGQVIPVGRQRLHPGVGSSLLQTDRPGGARQGALTGNVTHRGLCRLPGTPGTPGAFPGAAGPSPGQTPETGAEVRAPPPGAVTCIGFETPPFQQEANYSSRVNAWSPGPAVCHLLKIGCLVFSPPQVQLSLGKYCRFRHRCQGEAADDPPLKKQDRTQDRPCPWPTLPLCARTPQTVTC